MSDEIDNLIDRLVEEEELQEFMLPMKGRGFRQVRASARRQPSLPPDVDIPGPSETSNEEPPLPKRKFRPSMKRRGKMPIRRARKLPSVSPEDDPLEKYTTLPIPSKIGESYASDEFDKLAPERQHLVLSFIEYAEKEEDGPSSLICDICGLPKLTEEEASIVEEWLGARYVDICRCGVEESGDCPGSGKVVYLSDYDQMNKKTKCSDCGERVRVSIPDPKMNSNKGKISRHKGEEIRESRDISSQQILKSLGYRQVGFENRPGIKSYWMVCPEEKCSLPDLLRKLHDAGFVEAQIIGGEISHPGFYITLRGQEPGELYLGVYKKNKYGDLHKLGIDSPEEFI